jgi:hypothetical protein
MAAAAIIGGLLAVWYYFTLPPPNVKREIMETDSEIRDIGSTVQDFVPVLTEHKAETERKVMVIRGTVQREILDLGRDGLAAAALDEISIFRRSAEGSFDSRPARLDGAGGGILPER